MNHRSSLRDPSWHRQHGNTLVGVIIGLLLGLLIAAGIAVYMMRTPLPFLSNKPKPATALPPVAKADPAARVDAKSDTSGAEKTGDAAKPRFDFYKILPGKEDPATAAKSAPREPAKPAPAPPPQVATAPAGNSQGSYMIQAGSFQNASDADNMKAKLALIGLMANVEPTAIPDKGTWYRVRLGPYASLGEINHIRSQLASNGVDATLIKLKD